MWKLVYSQYNERALDNAISLESSNEAPNVKLSTVATFPINYFLENLAVVSKVEHAGYPL